MPLLEDKDNWIIHSKDSYKIKLFTYRFCSFSFHFLTMHM